MKNKKTTIFLSLILFIGTFALILSYKSILAQSFCPSNTTYGDTFATLVGEITDTGGDPNITAWFEWGPSSSLANTTPQQSLFVTSPPFRFCANISNLQPCTTYFYRAVAQNSAGTARGSVFSFTTRCVPLQVSCSASPNPANVNQLVTFTANISGGTGSYSYSWSGACTGSGPTCSRTFSFAGTYTANLTVTSGDQIQTVSCSVNVSAPAQVISQVNQSSIQGNQSPVPVISIFPSEIRPGTRVTFDASRSYDPDGYIVSYSWEIDNQVVSNNVSFSRVLAAKTYRIKLTVTDNLGVSNSKEVLISVGRNVFKTRTITRTVRVTQPSTTLAGGILGNLFLDDLYKLKECQQQNLSFTLVNNTIVKRRFEIKINNIIGQWFEPQTRSFTLEPEETRIIDWKVIVPCNLSEKKYQGTILLKTSGYEKSYPLKIEIYKESNLSNFLVATIANIGNALKYLIPLFLIVLILFLIYLAYRFYKFLKAKEVI